MQFSRSSSVPQLYWAVPAGSSTPSGTSPVAGFLLPQNATGAAVIQFGDAWQNLYEGSYGSFIFLDGPVAPGNEAALASQIWNYISGNESAGVFWRFFWVNTSGSIVVSISLQPPAQGSTEWTVYNQPVFAFANYSLNVSSGVQVFADPGGSALIWFHQPASSFNAIVLVANGTTLPAVTSDVGLSFSDPGFGALNFTMQFGGQDLDTLDVGLRYFYPGAKGSVASLRYPIFATSGITATVTLDPLAPLDPARCFFALAQGTMASFFQSDTGAALSLSATNGSWIFTPREGGNYYLAPAGDFQIVSDQNVNFLCGLSGVEYVKIQANNANLRFIPGQAAFAPSFGGGSAGTGTTLLRSDYLTSWAYVWSSSGSLPYSAQPENSTLYKPQGAPSQGPVPTPLYFMEVIAAQLPQPAAATLFPMAPYLGLSGAVIELAQKLELQILSPARRSQILTFASGSQPACLEADGSPATGVTPQGLLAEFDASGVTLTLAVNQDNSQVQLTGVGNGTSLWNALQTNQLFLVVTDPSTLAPYLTPPNAAIRIGDPTGTWTFDLDPAKWRSTGDATTTFFVMKFFNNKTLLELAGQPGSWTQGDGFNKGNSTGISGALVEFLNYAVSASATKPDFEPFVNNVVQNANWNGILVLNVPDPGVPAGLGGILAGVDPTLLAAHHIGLNFSPVQVNGTTPSIQPSSLFGLIDYENTTLPKAADAGFAFQMLSLDVLFLNSAVARFSSQAALQTNELFGEPASLPATNNCIILNGVYQSSGSAPAYVFTTDSASVFQMTSGVLNQVIVSQAQFLSATTPGAATVSNFALWGAIDFQALPDLDVFSFGAGQGGSGGLSFSNVGVTMTTTAASDGLPPQTSFEFSAAKLAFDLQLSSYRTPSLYQQFPLQLKTFLETASSSTPADLGYMAVTSTASGGLLTAPWYGLQFDLELGSFGAWAAEKGFVASFLAAWSPTGSSKANVFLGLQLPGSSGSKKEITLEGPLKLSIQNIQLGSQTNNGETAYLMWLQSIALSLFSVSLPPSGRTDFVLFGGPSATPGQNTIGWYAAYSKTAAASSSGSGTKSPQLALKGEK